MCDLSAQIAANLTAIRARVEAACQRAARSPQDVRLVAVTKYARPQWVQALIAQGQRVLAESRPQQLIERAQSIGTDVQWHLIGHLQRNKVRAVLPHVRLIHSVDSLRLAERISDISGQLSLRPSLLLEANVSGEAAKDGFEPDRLLADWPSLAALPNLQIAGLMTMAPAASDPEAARATFRALRQLRNKLQDQYVATLDELSMGMSGDFEVAIEEGATLIRIGSALFEGLEGTSDD